MGIVYDPENIRVNAIDELMRRALVAFPSGASGGGVYAMFYEGPLKLYAEISGSGAVMPIYVGSTVNFRQRLGSHKRSIETVTNLRLDQFHCRVLPLPAGWHTVIELALIAHFNPMWNQPTMAGFGNNARRPVRGEATPWDLFHPGRPSAQRLKRGDTDLAEHLHRDAADEGILALFGDA